jgi:hypothetical protein
MAELRRGSAEAVTPEELEKTIDRNFRRAFGLKA